MSSQPSRYYYPQLDSVRGIAFFFVFSYHSWKDQLGKTINGEFSFYLYRAFEFSIDVFFVLSSFLLTLLGLYELERNKDFSFKNYFIRRLLRIWPLYYFMMLVAFIIIPIIAGKFNVTVTLPSAPYYLFFISNFYLPDHVYFLRFLWTISVEEQFYLVLGAILLLWPKRLPILIGLMAISSMVFNIYNGSKENFVFFHTMNYVIDFCVGAIAAISIYQKNAIVRYFSSLSKPQSLTFVLLVFVVLFIGYAVKVYFFAGNENLGHNVARILFTFYVGFFLIDQMVNKNKVLKLEKPRLFIYTGKISYGLYVYHGLTLTIGFLIINRLGIDINTYLFSVILFAVNFLIAHLSYQYFEKPFLAMKDKLRRI